MMRQESAETVALQALAWLAANEDLFPTFLGSTGAELSQVALRAQEPAFLASVLDFVLMDDAWVIAFCDGAGLPYTTPRNARAVMPGGEAHWS